MFEEDVEFFHLEKDDSDDDFDDDLNQTILKWKALISLVKKS